MDRLFTLHGIFPAIGPHPLLILVGQEDRCRPLRDLGFRAPVGEGPFPSSYWS